MPYTQGLAFSDRQWQRLDEAWGGGAAIIADGGVRLQLVNVKVSASVSEEVPDQDEGDVSYGGGVAFDGAGGTVGLLTAAAVLHR